MPANSVTEPAARAALEAWPALAPMSMPEREGLLARIASLHWQLAAMRQPRRAQVFGAICEAIARASAAQDRTDRCG